MMTDVSERIDGEVVSDDANVTGQFLEIERISTLEGNYGHLNFPLNYSADLVSVRFRINIAPGNNERYV